MYGMVHIVILDRKVGVEPSEALLDGRRWKRHQCVHNGRQNLAVKSAPLTATALWVSLVAGACTSDSPSPFDPGGEPECLTVDLLPGEDVMFEGSAAVDCVEIPSFVTGDRYEVVVSTMSRTLGFSPMELRITSTDSAPVVQAVPVSAVPQSNINRPVPDLDEAWRNGQSAMDASIRAVEGPLLAEIRTLARAGGAGLYSVPAVGDEVSYGFSCVSRNTYPKAPSTIDGIVRHVSQRAVIVEDVLSAFAFTEAEFAEIGRVFDEVIYDTDVRYFGAPGDIDANGGRIVLLYTAGVKRLSEDYTDSFVSGFTCPLDLGPSGGNRAEMFYLMVPDPDGDYTIAEFDGVSKAKVRRITDNTIAHEFQHLINAQSGKGGANDVWLNEGLSHLAEEVTGHAVNGFAPGSALGADELLSTPERLEVFNKYYLNNWYNLTQYLAAPGDTAALLNTVDPLNTNTFRMRGAAWSFLRYLLDRFEDGVEGESARTRALVQSAAADSRDAIGAVFGQPFDRLATHWSTMLVSSDRADVEPSEQLELTSYRLRDVFDSRIGNAVNPPTGGYPLRPEKRHLGFSTAIDAELFSATSLYVELETTRDGRGTRVELVAPGGRGMLDSSIEPRLQILRVN